MTTVPLRRIAAVVNGGTPTADDANWGGEVPWATPVDLGRHDGRLIAATECTLTDRGLETGSALVPERSIILSTRAPIGYACVNKVAMAFNQGCRGLIPRANVSPEFLRYALLHLRPQLQAAGTGSTFMELSTGALASMPVPVVGNLAQQDAVVDFLDRETAKIDALIAKQDALVTRLREHRRSMVAEAVEGVLVPPSGARLKHFVTEMRQGWSPQCESVRADGVTEWGVLKTGCVNGGVFHPEENKLLPADIEPRPETVVRRGEIVVSRASTRDLVGSAAVVEREHPRLMLSDKTYAITVDQRVADPRFISLLLSSPRIREAIELEATGASHSMQNVSKEDLLNLLMPLPPVTQQVEAVREVESETSKIYSMVAKAKELSAALRERRAALITAAVTGKLDVSTYGKAG